MTHDEFDDFDFTLPSDHEGERRAYRTSVPGLEARVAGKDGTFPVENVSAVGIAMHAAGHAFTEGEVLKLDLLIQNRPYIPALPARVARRVEDGLVGCEFTSLSGRNRAWTSWCLRFRSGLSPSARRNPKNVMRRPPGNPGWTGMSPAHPPMRAAPP